MSDASFDVFHARVRRACAESRAHGRAVIVPVWSDYLLDADTPVGAFHKLRNGPFAFLLESAPAGSETWARYTFLGSAPSFAWRLRDGVVDRWTPQTGWSDARPVDDPLEELDAILRAAVPLDTPELSGFWTGAVGYVGYDVVRAIESLPAPPPRATAQRSLPDAIFVFTGAVVIIDNLRAQARIVVGVTVPAGADDAAEAWRAEHGRAVREIDATIARLRSAPALPPLTLAADAAPATGATTYARDRFLADVRRIKEYIVAGDAFQVLLARRIEVPHDFPAASLYRALRALNPSPYMYHLVLDGIEIVGSSPELLVRVDRGTVTVRPIAGTVARGRNAAEDDERAAHLAGDEKERAEHLMLVDLGRNDVGRVARYGTVRVTELMAVERYSHVFHLVSQVDGQLRDGLGAMDALRASFPAGTMTGAPKVRAMQIIDELEPDRRGAYAGAIGYIAAGSARMDLAITIRTCVMADGTATVQAGAGIVYDSVPEREWEETENKARALLTAIGQVRGGSARDATRDATAAAADRTRR